MTPDAKGKYVAAHQTNSGVSIPAIVLCIVKFCESCGKSFDCFQFVNSIFSLSMYILTFYLPFFCTK